MLNILRYHEYFVSETILNDPDYLDEHISAVKHVAVIGLIILI